MKNIEFIKKKNITFTISLIIVAIALISIATRGLNLGIDFTGGSQLQYKFASDFNEDDIRAIMDDMGLQAKIQKAGENEVLIKTTFLDEDQTTQLRNTLKEKVAPFAEDGIRAETKFYPTIGKELRENAFKAILWAIIAILIYISIRFDFKFAVAAIIALIHDSIITIGVFSVLQRTIDNTMIAALLTLLGYSLNDTIVVSDRIRENIRRMKNVVFGEMVNTSINQSLSRTIHTSLTTLIPVVILLFFAGETLKNFALALFIGVIVGTYSSIFIVSPLITIWNKGKVLK
ncbi:MAG: protein translocase subunit SecF [Candidatus Muiribacterium halophilum]|uniref:Protein-export membrane protein SecF n=1 Tax=Muiribacterium halophilum TaxID=2053465 RepID=A0A2N5ZHB4_MUIH1|nr:MAG: protein translocase subunit SecF [Candidatus Muirbacterium halophilum]